MGTEPSMKILYDGNCPVCRRKTRFLQKHDRRRKLDFVDICAKDFQPPKNGIPMAELEHQIHAALPDGTVIRGMEVIRAAYREIGFGWIAAPTGWPPFRRLFDLLYSTIAKHRHAISHLFN